VWRKLHNEELEEPYSLPNIIWFVMSRSWGGVIIGKRCVQGMVGKAQRKSLRGRRRHRWEDDIKLIIQNVGLGIDWIDLTQDRDRGRAFENAKMHCHFREMWKIS
jgi:hypothetical protein